jgi:hypothetical protein
MPTRYKTIPDAYRATFEWVFNEEYRPAALGVAHDLITSNHCSLSADTFVSWLKSDQKLYWVTGKPGAGKSTLMKFLSSHRSLKPISKEWTNRNDSKNFSNHVDSVIELWNGEYPYPGKGRRQFRVGTYFFWNPGSPMQKSKRGLCQTLLYQLLNQDIERVADVFPERWARHEHYGGDMRGFNDTELWNALRRLLSVHDRRYLLFIDGLDEIEDKPTELADMTLEFARMPAVKICAASRPWVEFQDKFHGLPRLSVEELTKYDILNYISGHLEDSPAFSVLRAHDDAQAQTLILDVAKRASGVFLWIFVVVESLLEGLRDGDNFSKLEQRLSDLPTELDALFTRILKQVPPRYAVDASEMFQLVRAHPEDSSLLALYLADQPVSAALKAPFAPVPQATLAYYLDVMRRKVYSRCKCLLQVSTLEGEDVKVSYLHRTVRDYLQQPHIWDDIRARNSEYDADCSIAISWLQQIKMGMVSGAQLEAWRDKFIRMVYYIALNKTLTIMNKIALLDATDEVRSFIVDQIPQLKRTCQQWPWGQPWERRDVLGLLPHGSRWTLYQSTIYGVAFGADFGWYVDAKLKEQPDLVSNPINMGYPLYTAVEHGLWNVTEALLDHGADPNFSTDVMAHGHSAWLLLLKHIQTLIKRGNLKARGRGYMSLLNSFLSKGASLRAEGGSVKPETVISEVLTVLRGKEYEHEREALSGRFEQALKDDKGARRITFKGIRS